MFIDNKADRRMENSVQVHNTCIKKLQDISLENVFGGLNYMQYHSGVIIGSVIGAVGAVGLLGCSIGGTICKLKAIKAAHAGNSTQERKLEKIAQNLGIAASAFSVPTIGGFAAAAICQYKKPHIPISDGSDFVDPLLAEEMADEENED